MDKLGKHLMRNREKRASCTFFSAFHKQKSYSNTFIGELKK